MSLYWTWRGWIFTAFSHKGKSLVFYWMRIREDKHVIRMGICCLSSSCVIWPMHQGLRTGGAGLLRSPTFAHWWDRLPVTGVRYCSCNPPFSHQQISQSPAIIAVQNVRKKVLNVRNEPTSRAEEKSSVETRLAVSLRERIFIRWN